MRLFKFKYYTTIDDLPVFNWFKIQETNDVTWMLHKKRNCSKSQQEELEGAIKKVVDEYIDTFGVSDDYRKILELKRDISIKEIDFAITQDRSELTFINVLKAQLKSAANTNKSAGVDNLKVHVAKYLNGSWPDFKVMSVKDFYSIVMEIKRDASVKLKSK